MASENTQQFCTECGAQRETGSAFCVSCGAPFGHETEQVGEAQAAAIPPAASARAPKRQWTMLIGLVVAAVVAGGLAYWFVSGRGASTSITGLQSPPAVAEFSASPSRSPTASETVTGLWKGTMDAPNYTFRMKLRERSDGTVHGWVLQTDRHDRRGKERVSGSRTGRSLELRGNDWAFAPAGWKFDTFHLKVAADVQGFAGTYECDGCAGNPYDISGRRA